MEKKIIIEEVHQEELANYSSMIEKLFAVIFKAAAVSKEDKEKVFGKLNEEISGRPFKVAIIGQAGVGKSSTLNAVFGLNLPTSDIDPLYIHLLYGG